VIKDYRRQNERAKTRAAAQLVASSATPAVAPNGTDEDVEPMESISCEEIVQRKFEHAKAGGYVISLD
jgi:hypothetical protein